MNRREEWARAARTRAKEQNELPSYITRPPPPRPRAEPMHMPPPPPQQKRGGGHAERLARFNQRPTLAPSFGSSASSVAVRSPPRREVEEDDGYGGGGREKRPREESKRTPHNVDGMQQMHSVVEKEEELYLKQPKRLHPEDYKTDTTLWRDVHGFTQTEILEIDKLVRLQRNQPLGNHAERINYVLTKFRQENNYTTRQLATTLYKCGCKNIWLTKKGTHLYGPLTYYLDSIGYPTIEQALARLPNDDYPVDPATFGKRL